MAGKRTWSLPLRVWLMLAVGIIVVAPLVAWLATLVVVLGPMKTNPTRWEVESRRARYQAGVLLEARSDQWADPSLQAELVPLLERAGVAATLLDRTGHVIWESGRGSLSAQPLHQLAAGPGTDDLPDAYPHVGERSEVAISYGGEQYVGVVRDAGGQLAGVYILAQVGQDPFYRTVVLVSLGGLLLAAGLGIWWIGRSVSRPVYALARAAQQVNEGTLDFEIPASRVRELNRLGAAFAAMRDGLQRSIYEQAGMEQERRLFIAAIAHDLRTPLSSVRGYLEGLRDGIARTPEKVAHYVAVALEKTGSLERLTESLFAYARTEYLSEVPQREALDLGELLVGAVEAVRPQAAAKGLTLVLAGGVAVDSGGRPAEACTVSGDRGMLGRVVDNLLDNALRYTPAGGTVEVGWTSVGTAAGSCRFWVRNSGPAIPDADLGRVFQPLYRGDAARGTRTGGAGLGLAIAQRLVQAHAGTIAVSNQGGTTFTVTLPQ